jgi:hypothetical protein
MPIFQIELDDGRKFEVDAEDQASALQAVPHIDKYHEAAQQRLKQNADLYGPMDDYKRKFAQGQTLGWYDDAQAYARAGLGSLLHPGSPTSFNERLKYEKAFEDERLKEANRRAGAFGTVAELAGGLATGGVGAKTGMTLLKEGMSLPKMIAAGSAEGAGYGAVAGGGEGDTFNDKLNKAFKGGAGGALAGAAVPLATAGAKMAASPVLSNLEAWRNPGAYADRKIAQTVERTGRSAQDILDEVNASSGQPYTLADALDYEGRRILSTVTKAPGNGRQEALDFLHTRQSDQPDRVVNILREGFDAPKTAAQTEKDLRAQRKVEADVNYGNARNSAEFVDPSQAIGVADNYLEPGVGKGLPGGSNLPDDTVEAIIRRARGMLTNGDETLTDFRSAFRAKRDMDSMIDSANPTQQRELKPVRDALDDALANASYPYAAARDRFRQQSKQIEAVQSGKEAAGSALSQDVVPGFLSMPADQQAPFRAGFVDPLETRIVNNAAPGANRAKFSPNTQAKMEAFAVPERLSDMMARLDRERRMHSTLTEASGGSKTVENAADAADMGIDPAILSNLLSGNVKGAATAGARGVWNSMTGNTEAVRNELAKRLLPITGSENLSTMLPRVTDALKNKRKRNNAVELGVIRGLLNLGAQGAARF